ncbi:MAG: PAS domain-containing methyl-accepting chemotaxis protein [Hyphomicrobiales bacterium]|nr:PAS domain-containing methyl-accepting chemotaxis protein [Hyphomicrobiales bacterium]
MFGFSIKPGIDQKALFSVLESTMEMVEFNADGEVRGVNDRFCKLMGTTSDQLKGEHVSSLLSSDVDENDGFRQVWRKLAMGEIVEGSYRLTDGEDNDIVLQSTFLPIEGRKGELEQVVLMARCSSSTQGETSILSRKMEALNNAQAMIEFDVDGNITSANENFCQAMGYELSEITGKHHSMFVDPAFADSVEYRDFWQRLGQGEVFSSQFKRFGKNGKHVAIQASYSPVKDENDRVVGIVKIANDITDRIQAIDRIGDCLSEISKGNIGARIDDVTFEGGLERLRENLNLAADQFAGAINNIQSTSESIGTGIREIVSASDDLSQRTESQAAALEETSATLNRITETVKQSTESAEKTQAIVLEAKQDAQTSGEVVERALTAMGEIEGSANEISQIISVIDEIAFQTNLLALNAGVEAARAGDAGQGFAVVASEVRALAQRSADAAKEIKALISKSDEQVTSGSKLVGEAGDKLKRIADQVLQISSAVDAIAASSVEQSQSLVELNTAVGQMDQGTQQNAAMAEQATAACHSLNSEVAHLEDSMRHFDLGPDAVNQVMDRPQPEVHRPAKSVVEVMQQTVAEKMAARPVPVVAGNAVLESDGWEEF